MAVETTGQRVSMEVRVAMVRLGLSQRDLAAKLGMSRGALSRRLIGDVPFDTNELDQLAEILGTTTADLVTPTTTALAEERVS